jgi:hypothetical protein
MRRSTLVLAMIVGAAVLDVTACNGISGVGDYSFGTASSTSGGAGGPTTTTTTEGTAGSTASGGGAGGAELTVDCSGKVSCSVVANAKACCFDNPTIHKDAGGHCTSGKSATDDCNTNANDKGYETRIECATPDDCPNEFCCGTYGGPNPDAGEAWYTIVSCKKKCEIPDRIICDPKGQKCPVDDGGTEAGACAQSQLLPTGYDICQ